MKRLGPTNEMWTRARDPREIAILLLLLDQMRGPTLLLFHIVVL